MGHLGILPPACNVNRASEAEVEWEILRKGKGRGFKVRERE